MGKIRKPLADKILQNSVSKNLTTAIGEWQTISKIHNEIDKSIRCLCGQPGIKDWYELKNVKNGKTLIHIGANCIEYFTAATDFLPAQQLKKLGKLKRQASQNQEPVFTKTNFPKPLINYLWENDVFTERPENGFHAHTDYKRFTDLIYKGGRSASHSPQEYDELISLWQDYIKPFLLDQPRKELHLEILDYSNLTYQKRIIELEKQVAQLQEHLQKLDQKNIAASSKPSSYQTLQTISRRRKNKRDLLPSDLNQELLNYLQGRDFLTEEQVRKLKQAMANKSYILNDYLRKDVQLILADLTKTIKADKKG